MGVLFGFAGKFRRENQVWHDPELEDCSGCVQQAAHKQGRTGSVPFDFKLRIHSVSH